MSQSSQSLIFTLFFFLLFISACTQTQKIHFQESSLEKYKPLIHFSPAKGWMNDPNGLVYLDGEYHLFFQHYPDSTVWGPMHWGHSVSTDLINWEELPIAIYPDSLGYIFSGSIVYDQDNSSELGTSETPPLVAIFTYHDMVKERAGEQEYQSQGIAFSTDKGRTWTKLSGNPVLPNQGIKDFRDPKVSQVIQPDGSKLWVMTLAVMDRIQFYGSENLKDWSLLSEFGIGKGAHGGVWECPDLIEIKGSEGESKWVLLVSINPGGPQKGSATQYFIGNFENGKFTPDDELIRWLDYGPDNYAGVTWANLPQDQNRKLFIGWMSNWLYAQVVPTQTWRSAMTLPRELGLFKIEDTYLVKSRPAKELELNRGASFSISETTSKLPGPSFEFSAEVDDEFALIFKNESGESLTISKEFGLVTVDRSSAGKASFHPDFPAAHSAPMSWEAKTLQIYMDASSIETFVNEGEIVMTSLLFPASPWTSVELIRGVQKPTLYEIKK